MAGTDRPRSGSRPKGSRTSGSGARQRGSALTGPTDAPSARVSSLLGRPTRSGHPAKRSGTQGPPNRPLSRPERRARIRRRRNIVLVSATAGVSALVLASWFPLSSMEHQRRTLAQDTAQLHSIQHQNQVLRADATALKNPAVVGRIARQQYQLEEPSKQVYEVLPASGKSGAGQYAGDPGLQSPVAPGHSSQVPAQAQGTQGGAGSAAASSGSGALKVKDATHSGSTSPSSLLGRIRQTLEFWR